MKILHCADIHLDSRLNANLDRGKSSVRKAELLCTFSSMVEYASLNGISHILIAGDLFDRNWVSNTAGNAVLDAINNHPDIHFYYVRGNHGNEGFLSDTNGVPKNLHLFDNKWTKYTLTEGVSLYGTELSADNCLTAPRTLVTDIKDYNIVMLHGQESLTDIRDDSQVINIKEYRNRGIDYMALGHIHYYKSEKLDERGIYCYSGCLEGRGFDECGDHGFVVLDIDTERRKAEQSFVSFAKRRLYTIKTDISDCRTSNQIIAAIRQEIGESDALEKDMLKIVLTGDIDVETEINTDFIRTALEDEFFYLKIVQETHFKVDYAAYALDKSLKGEFVRSVMNDSTLSDETKAEAIRLGIQAITSE